MDILDINDIGRSAGFRSLNLDQFAEGRARRGLAAGSGRRRSEAVQEQLLEAETLLLETAIPAIVFIAAAVIFLAAAVIFLAHLLKELQQIRAGNGSGVGVSGSTAGSNALTLRGRRACLGGRLGTAASVWRHCRIVGRGNTVPKGGDRSC